MNEKNQLPPERKAMTVPLFRQSKLQNKKLVVVTAYDYTSGLIAEAAGVDAILIGDSLGMVVQGKSNPLDVSIEDCIYHTKCIARAVSKTLIIADMPFGTYHESPAQAVRNAVLLMKAGAHAIKLEGGERVLSAVQAILNADIPVMGHIGLTPQSVNALGGFKVQRDEDKIMHDAKLLDEAGVFGMVVECVPKPLGDKLTKKMSVPTIGIGAGPGCDGQILVWHDLLGLYDHVKPKFVKRYINLAEQATKAVQSYASEVRNGQFPGPEHSFS